MSVQIANDLSRNPQVSALQALLSFGNLLIYHGVN